MTLARIPDSQGVVAAVGIPQRGDLVPGAGPVRGEALEQVRGAQGAKESSVTGRKELQKRHRAPGEAITDVADSGR